MAAFRGKWVVLYFYPKDMTTGCTIEAHNFQRDLPMFDKRNAVIVGISVDSLESHQQFCTKESLTFRMLSDPDHNITSAYGSLTQFGDTVVAARNTFLIDPKGVVRKIYTKVNPGRHSDDVLAALTDLQQEQLQNLRCKAGWQQCTECIATCSRSTFTFISRRESKIPTRILSFQEYWARSYTEYCQ